jgi:anaerobic glycerol-3-phosphate dehydrogenase
MICPARSVFKVHAVEGAGIDEALRRLAALPSDQRWTAMEGLTAGSALIQFVNTLLALLRELPLGTHAPRSDELLLLLNEATLAHYHLSVGYLRQREAATAMAEVFMSNGMDTSLSTQGYVIAAHRLHTRIFTVRSAWVRRLAL